MGDARSPGYQSNTDLVQVINNILRNRELKLTTKIKEDSEALAKEMVGADPEMLDKINKLQDMTRFAVDSLQKLLNSKVISTERFIKILRLIS